MPTVGFEHRRDPPDAQERIPAKGELLGRRLLAGDPFVFHLGAPGGRVFDCLIWKSLIAAFENWYGLGKTLT